MPAPHLPHEQPLHRLGPDQVAVDLVDSAALVAGQLEGQRVQPGGDPILGRGQSDPLAPRDPPAAAGDQGRLVEEQLLEGEALPGGLGGMLLSGKVRRRQAVGGARHAQFPAQAPGDRLHRVPGHRHRLPNPLADALRAQSLGGRVHRDHPGGVEASGCSGHVRVQELVLGDVEAALLELPAQQQPRAGDEPVRQPGPVEPDGLHLAARIRYVCLEDRQAPAPSRPQLRAAHLDLDGRLLPQPQLPDADRLGPITVAVGDVAQQIAEARDLHLGRRARQLRARSAQLGDRRIENRRARRRLQRRLQQRLALQDFPGSQLTRRVDLGRDRVAVEGGLHRHLG